MSDMNNGHADRFKFRVWNDMQKCYSMDDHYISEDGFMNTVGDYILEQCTGLKDKNGNLIYEGDIVKTHLKRKGIVLWNEICWCYRTLDKVSCTYIMESYDIKILGNIHENADLLENEE